MPRPIRGPVPAARIEEMRTLFRRTTIVCVRSGERVAMAGDGQVTLGSQIVKSGAKKVRRLFNGKILTGFAGSTADAMTLLERFEDGLEREKGDLMKASTPGPG